MKENKHYVYMLECKDGTFYTGYTTDIDQRMKKHSAGKGAKYTRGRGPFRLVYQREYDSKSEALRAEYRLKQRSRKEKEQLVFRHEQIGEWHDETAKE
ncbi:GIY-YIG nuclease family protein [Aliibacillus thermotolerans]|uniref:GIY-YIG nuclease family protein n=1 Tax=Aliibacillus thermotolerans TaxID=1834418 RepID=A0ABW0U8H9_9BACI|nr:GIY-YIG nuclease family protein [Aliibacillus thermotolerans]MDA3128874.1 GIY-YIG nuclease family protein [Aliibacillus thermotolerans]